MLLTDHPDVKVCTRMRMRTLSAQERESVRIPLECNRETEMSGVRKSLWVCICRASLLRHLIVKQSCLVDKIIELCLKWPGYIKDSLGWSISRYNVLCTVVYSTLFMENRSGTTLKVLFFKDIHMFLEVS